MLNNDFIIANFAVIICIVVVALGAAIGLGIIILVENYIKDYFCELSLFVGKIIKSILNRGQQSS